MIYKQKELKILRIFLYVLSLSPILSLITEQYLGNSIYYYGQLFILVYGVICILNGNIKKILPFHWLLLLFAIYVLISTFFNGVFEKKGLLYTGNLCYFSFFFVSLVIYNSSYKKKDIMNFIRIFFISIVIHFIFVLIQVKIPDFFMGVSKLADFGDTIYTDRRSGFFSYINDNSSGIDFMAIFSLLVSFILLNKIKTKYIYSIMFLGAIVSFLSNSRYIIFGYFLIILLYIIQNKISITNGLKISLGAIFLLFLAALFLKEVIGYDFQSWFSERLFAEGSVKETTRYRALGTFMTFFPKNPFFGVGGLTDEIRVASNAVESSQIHVGYLSMLVYHGLIGTLILLSAWFLLLKKYYKTAMVCNYWGSFFALAFFLWANASLVMFDMFYYGLIFAMVFDKYYSDKISNLKKSRLYK